MRRTTKTRFAVAAASSVIVLTLPVAAALASAPPSPWPVTTADPTTAYHETANIPITMSDGVILEADEYIPTTCTAATRCPVVLIQTPYRKGNSTSADDMESESDETIPYLYEHGYIEVVVDVRGTGSSEGYWSSFGPREQQDGAELAQWVADPARIPASNGHVALAGVSYSGINQLLTVEAINGDIAGHGPLTDAGSGCISSAASTCANPTHITSDPVGAIFPIVSMTDAYRDVTFAGGNLDSGFMPLWLGLVNGLAVQPPDTAADPSGSNTPIALNAESQHLEDLATFAVPVIAGAELGSYESETPFAQSYPDQAYDSPFYTQRSPITDIGEVNVPTFLVGGTYDLFQRGEPINYNALDLPPTQKKLLIGPWYHVTEGSNLPATDTAGNTIPDVGDLELDWFDHWVPGPNNTRAGTNNRIDSFPTVESYDLGSDKWEPGSAYPSTGTTGQRWYLGPNGSLSTTKPPQQASAGELPTVTATGTCSRSTWQWTAGIPTELTEPSPVCESNSTSAEVQGLTFTAAAQHESYTLSGPIEADIYMSSSAANSTVIATLSDVSSNEADDITAGSLVASLRNVTTTPCHRRRDPATGTPFEVVLGCSEYLDGQSIDPWHPYTEASQIPLGTGKITELQIEVFPTHATIEPGHQLRLTITTSDAPHEAQSLSTTASALGVDTFYEGGDAPSSIYVGTTTPGNA